MNRLAGSLLVTLFLLTSTSLGSRVQSTATDSPRGSLEGAVVDSVTGQPIGGAHVVLVSGQALPEEAVRDLLTDQKPTLQTPQITKVLPAFVLGGQVLDAERNAHSVLTDVRGRFTFLTGKVVVADGKPIPVATSILPIPLQLMFRPLNALQPAPLVTAVSTEDGSFEVNSALEGKYRFSILPLRDNYYVSEARLYGARVMNGILDISGNTASELILTLSPGGQIKGSVVGKKGQVAPQAQGVVLPDPPPDIIPFYKTLSADPSGHFTVDGVPPGNYRIYVWEGAEPSQFFDRDLLARTRALALPVRMQTGSTVSAAVTMIAQ